MPSRDLRNNIDVQTSLAPTGNRTASANGTGVATGPFESTTVVFQVGTITNGTHTPSVEVSDDDSTYTAASASQLIGSLAALASNTNQRVGVVGPPKYVRAVVTVTGSPATGGQYAAIVVRGHPRTGPVA